MLRKDAPSVEADDFDEHALYRAISKGESLHPKKGAKAPFYRPLLRHPLPINEAAAYHKQQLKRCQHTKLEKQAMAAVVAGDAWVLEELYMLGVPVDVINDSGYTPLHIAAQLNNYDCILVLLNIPTVDVNCRTYSGATALYLAISAGSKQAEKLLREKGGTIIKEHRKEIAGFSVLDQPEKRRHFTEEVIEPSYSKVDAENGLPRRIYYS
jgi:hypothetical protein